MHLALHMYDDSDEVLKMASQLGATHFLAFTRLPDPSGYFEFIDLLRFRKKVESFGLQLGGVVVPRDHYLRAIYGQPGRDEQLDNVCRTIRNVGKAGIPTIGYDFSVAWVWGHWRSGQAGGGRGGAGLISFDYDLVKDAPEHPAGAVGSEEMWDRFAYFLRRVVPVAEEAGVRLACHPDDPPAPQLRGTARILSSVEGMKRQIETVPSHANGVLFCQGTVAEMEGVGPKVVDAIRYFGSRDKIVYVHFRNVRGTFPRFDETFPDDGDVDMLASMRAYKEVGFDGLLIPDHSPVVVGDEGGYRFRGMAFALGHMRGLMQAVGA
jgi:mannonate dehydratase